MLVKVGQANTLDFQLSTILGCLVAHSPKEEFVIVSKDKGFDLVGTFWKGRGVNVKRSEVIA